MTKFIKLTNNNESHEKGTPIYINRDHIASIREVMMEGIGFKTVLFSPLNGLYWEVEESPSVVVKLFEGE